MCAANLKVTNNKRNRKIYGYGSNNGKYNEIAKDHKEAQRMRGKKQQAG